MEEKTKTIVLELTETEYLWLNNRLQQDNNPTADIVYEKFYEAVNFKHQRLVVDIFPIEEMPEGWKDGREVLVWSAEDFEFRIAKHQVMPIGSPWVERGRDKYGNLLEVADVTHVAAMLPDVEVEPWEEEA